MPPLYSILSQEMRRNGRRLLGIKEHIVEYRNKPIYNVFMEIIEVLKALSNEKRLQILQWLKEPEKYFPKQQAHLPKEVHYKGGVCVGDIQEKVQASQSTVSQHLAMMQRAGLLESVRYNQWTYYRRNENTIKKLVQYLDVEL